MMLPSFRSHVVNSEEATLTCRQWPFICHIEICRYCRWSGVQVLPLYGLIYCWSFINMPSFVASITPTTAMAFMSKTLVTPPNGLIK